MTGEITTRRSMHQMTPGQARVIDPILSEIVLGYSNPDRVGRVLAPSVDLTSRGAKVIRFDKASFRRVNARRAPGSKTKRIQYGYTSDPVALVQDALEGVAPWELSEEAQEGASLDLGAMAVSQTMNTITLNEEIEQAELATNPNNYDNNHKVALSGTDKWSHADSDPGEQMDDYKEAVRRSIGMAPNTILLSAQAFRAAKRNRTIRDQFKYTNSTTITLDMLKAYFEVDNIAVGRAIYINEGAPDTTDPTDVWGNNIIVAYVPPPADRSRGFPSFMYTYVLAGHPYVEEMYQDRSEKSDIYPVTHERRPYLVGAEAGFLIQNPA